MSLITAVLTTVTTTSADTNPPPSPLIPLHPYPQLHGGRFVGPLNPDSPDPIHNYVWDIDKLDDPYAYQTYSDLPVNVTTDSPSSFTGLDTLTSPNGSVSVTGAGVLVLKFAQEGACWVEFESSDLTSADVEVRMTLSENSFMGEVQDLLPVKHNNTYRLEPNNQLYEGIRYIFINVTAPGNWHFQNFVRTCQVVPTNYVGKFDSNDRVLNRIWWTGAYTTKVTEVGNGVHSTNAGYLGSELKDRGDRIAFLGDAHVTQATALVAFGNYKLLNNSNQFTKNIGNNIEPYWLMWIDSVLDLYDHTGDGDTVKGLSSWIEKRLDHANDVAESGASLFWSRDDDRMGFGFASPDKPEARRAFRALLVGASRRYAKASKAYGNQTSSMKYEALANKWTANITSGGRDWHILWGMHASADAILAGLVTPNIAHEMIADTGVFGNPLLLPSLSNFESFFILKALSEINATDQALYLLHRHWDGMLRLGATTTWERFDPQWEDSKCIFHDYPPVNAMNQDTSMSHPWASGATSFLSKYALGIVPVKPGFVEWDVIPKLVNNRSLRWVDGAMPTPFGAIKASINLENGTASLYVPKGTRARFFGIPQLSGLRNIRYIQGNQSTTIWCNGTSCDEDINSTIVSVTAGCAHGFICLERLPPGSHKFQFDHSFTEVSHATMLPMPNKWDPNNTDFNYTARLVGVDYSTGGNWIGKYGNRGYVLFNYSTVGNDVSKLPAEIAEVWLPTQVPKIGGPPFPDATRQACQTDKGFGGCVIMWSNSTNSPQVLQNPQGPNSARRAVGITSKRWSSYELFVVAKDTHTPYNVTIYMVDYEKAAIRQGFKVMDIQSRTIGPIAVVEDFSGGAYVTYHRLGGSMSFRMLELPSRQGTVKGFPPRPVVSGVFFD